MSRWQLINLGWNKQHRNKQAKTIKGLNRTRAGNLRKLIRLQILSQIN